MRKFLLHPLFHLSVAYVALLPQIYLLYDRGNRYTLDWSPQYRWAVLLAIAILAAIYGMSFGVLRWIQMRIKHRKWSKPLRKIPDIMIFWFLMAVLFRSVMAIAYSSDQLPSALAICIDARITKLFFYVLLPSFLLAVFRRRTREVVFKIYGVFAIVFLLFVVQTFVWPSYAADYRVSDMPPAAEPPANSNSVYIFLFDGWSYNYTFGHSSFSLDHMPHLQKMLQHSTLFTRAYSPGVLTTVSVPRLLFQTDPRIHNFSHTDLKSKIERNEFLLLQLKSIFDLSDNHYSFTSGCYIHYPGILGKNINGLIPFYSHNSRYTLPERILNLLYTQLAFLEKFGIRIPSPTDPLGSMFEEFQVRIRPHLEATLPRLPYPNISFFHINLPHSPYLFDRHWNRRTSPPQASLATISDYLENVYAVDVVIGDIIDHLKTRSDYDSSLILILSDHGWRESFKRSETEADMDPEAPEKHVPLIIKYPGQKRAEEDHSPVYLTDLHPLINMQLTQPEMLRQWVLDWNDGTRPARPRFGDAAATSFQAQ
ncbi:MAG: sulfatase-like hydrolase/transferase [Lentisphaerae bacterium]|jgi:hypothetical protein|nr:sulfatase-like hydrolase/transferase [Lentisphaerota bacterium]